MAEEFLRGLNYWPAGAAMGWWSRFDAAAAEADLARFAAAGFQQVRCFLLWEAFQPAPDTVSPTALRDLERLADAAARQGIGLQPTLFTGHMSGANWLPGWAVEPSSVPGRFPTVVGGRARPVQARNFYVEPGLIEAQALLVREVARALAAHPALWSWDLGNEPSNVVQPPTREHGRRWLDRMVGALRAGGSERPVTIGLHMEDLEQDRRIGPFEAAEACDYLVMHGYPLYARWARDPLDAALLPFLALVTQWLGGKPVLFQEFGLPVRPSGWPERGRSGQTRLFDEADGQAFYAAALAALRRERLLGGFAWCAYDYAEQLWDQPPFDACEHERFFGLYRADGTPKATLQPWRELAAQRDGPLPPPHGLEWINLQPERYWDAPLASLQRLYGRFIEASRQ